MARTIRPFSRRGFAGVLIGLVAAPLTTSGQPRPVVRRVGWLGVNPPGREVEHPLTRPLRSLGWVEGENLNVESRYTRGSLEELFPLAQELVAARVEVVVADGPNPTLAAMRATATIPIVFAGVSEPVLTGLIASLARPGANVTGFSGNSSETLAKLLALVKEGLPYVRRIGVMEVAGNPQYALMRQGTERACKLAGIDPVFLTIGSVGELDDFFSSLARENAKALLLMPDSFALRHQAEIIRAAMKRGLPTFSYDEQFAVSGALATYSASVEETMRRSAYYVDRILRGAKPADLPVEEPSQYELVLNLKTAKALGLTLPRPLLLQASQLIQ